LVEERAVHFGRETPRDPLYGDTDAAVEAVVDAPRPRRGAAGAVVALARKEDDGNRGLRLVIQGGRQGRVMVLQRAQDLAPDVLVLFTVVPNVKMGQLTLGHPALVGHALRHAVQQGL